MSLKRKLALLKDAGPGSRRLEPAAAPPPTVEIPEPADSTIDSEKLAELERLRGLIRQVMERRPPEEPLPIELDVHPKELPGSIRENEEGEVHVAEELLEPHHCQGHQPIAKALDVAAGTIAQLALDPTLEGLDLQNMLFLDTETTGLVGGTGTIPFLIGLGWFEDQSLCVEQLFLRQLGQERPLLLWLANRLERSSMLVTYNGKTFDWPLIRTRYIMNQLPVPRVPPHLDLLHCARRVYKKRLGQVRLVHVEEKVLGMRREDDVDGSEIPLRYLDYLRTGNVARLVPVVEHNAHDIVSLAAVLARIGERYERLETSDDPEDHLGYAKVAQRVGDLDRALEFACAAAIGSSGRALAVEAYLMVAKLQNKKSDIDAEERALKAALEEAGWDAEIAAPVHLALAKLFEHRRKDLQRALDHAEHTALSEGCDEQVHRVARLHRRIERLQG